MDFIMWIVLGALAGWLASIIMKTNAEQGAIGNIVVGILGAFIGGFLMKTLTGSETDSFLGSLVVATIGAVILLAIVKAVRGRGRTTPV